jgi:hypothetical protein
MTAQRAGVIFALVGVLVGSPVFAAGPPPQGHWVVDYVEYDHVWSDPVDQAVKRTYIDSDLGPIEVTVGWRQSQAQQGWATATAWCYRAVNKESQPIDYEFSIGATAGVYARLILKPTGPNPGPMPTTWKQQGYVKSQTWHNIIEYGDPGPTWGISWFSRTKGGGAQDTKYDYRDWGDPRWHGETEVLQATGAWSYETTGWHGVGSVHGRVHVDCAIAWGDGIKAQVNHIMIDYECRHDP